jgi:SNF2 family DNA or RNA helicase
MAQNKADKKRLKRKEKTKQQRIQQAHAARSGKVDFLRSEAEWHLRDGRFEDALENVKKALQIAPNHIALLQMMGYCGQQLDRSEIECQALHRLYGLGALEDQNWTWYCRMLMADKKYEEAIAAARHILSRWATVKIQEKRSVKTFLQHLLSEAADRIRYRDNISKIDALKKKIGLEDSLPKKSEKRERPAPIASVPVPVAVAEAIPAPVEKLPQIPLEIEFDHSPLEQAWAEGVGSSPDQYDLAMDGYRIRLNETFDHLVCLSRLYEVRSLWYQEETAKKVLKRFRGRALLADEVGLGKTIEALMVFSEYRLRGMVKGGLILTPAPLVSQWKEELKSKFGFDIPSTDDADYRSGDRNFWQNPFVLASINQAKSQKNYDIVAEREYDIVIVDEAHHLKNRNTLNWKLINALKKKYLLMLTATPVENNLLELYNLITLLKPGQLGTASRFREEFMTRGDPTDPQNREKLKSLLSEVMIRNTRALANINIPPRFARTIRVETTGKEKELYERVGALVRQMNDDGSNHRKMLLKNLLAEAGSSPRALGLTLTRMLSRRDLLLSQEKEIEAIQNLCRTTDRTQKNRMLLNLVKATPGKIIVFVKYIGTLEHLSEFLAWERIPHAVFQGGMDNREKGEQIASFKQEKNILLTTEIGGEGRNLQFCHQMVNYDLPWNPMKIEQRIGRIHRIGQEKEVMIFNFCNAGSVEEYILEILDKKINMFEMVIGEIDMILGRVQGEQEFSDMIYDIWLRAASEAEKEASFSHLASRLKRSKSSYEKSKALDEKLFGETYEL